MNLYFIIIKYLSFLCYTVFSIFKDIFMQNKINKSRFITCNRLSLVATNNKCLGCNKNHCKIYPKIGNKNKIAIHV